MADEDAAKTSAARPGNGRVTIEITGGLGNQLFEYATARRLSLQSGVPLVLDKVSGFARDFYKRAFLLHHFDIRCEIADERRAYSTITGRIRRRLDRWINENRPLERKTYIQEKQQKFLPELLKLKVSRPVYMEGMWQHEPYFRDIRGQLLTDLTIKTPHDPVNQELAKKIASVDAVCLHVRRLHGVPQSDNATPLATNPHQHVGTSYYDRAIEHIAGKVRHPHFFVFSDFPDWARENVRSSFPMEFLTHNGPGKDYEDFWLMSLCRNFIIANSTFSWWAAWLSVAEGKSVVAPRDAIGHALQNVPPEWIPL